MIEPRLPDERLRYGGGEAKSEEDDSTDVRRQLLRPFVRHRYIMGARNNIHAIRILVKFTGRFSFS